MLRLPSNRPYSLSLRPRSIAIRPRLYFAALAGMAALVLLPASWPAYFREALAWDVSAGIYLVLAFRVMLTCKGEALRVRAARQDDREGRPGPHARRFTHRLGSE